MSGLSRAQGRSRVPGCLAVRAHACFSVNVVFKNSKGEILKKLEVNEGDDILAIAQEHDIDIEGAVCSSCPFPLLRVLRLFTGACEASIACSTCHVILEPEVYDGLPEADDDENDMLDMAFGLTDTSRLGCQVKITKEHEGMIITLPSATRNMFVDGAFTLFVCPLPTADGWAYRKKANTSLDDIIDPIILFLYVAAQVL
jgi:ferredoxin